MISTRQTNSGALLINALVSTGGLKEVEEYDVDFDHQFLETEKYDALLADLRVFKNEILHEGGGRRLTQKSHNHCLVYQCIYSANPHEMISKKCVG